MKNEKNKILISGNEAIALGAIKAGLKFYAAYPMTPASSILHFLAGHEHEYKILVKQTEDELAAMNMTIGASLAGVRAMCATAGGGFALMVEGLGFGGMIETPLVVGVVSRPGPATSMPTWSAQGDLRFVMHAAPDEFPRIILAPGDAAEAYHLTFRAFNLADKYQLPVIILSDKNLAESYFTVEQKEFSEGNFAIDRGRIAQALTGQPNSTYLRYDPSIPDGVSPRAIPGTPGRLFLANSDEHDEVGYSEEDSASRSAQMDKRMRKIATIIKNQSLGLPKWYGPAKANLTLICWGSNKGVALAAISQLPDCNVLHFSELYPLDVPRVQAELGKIKRSLCVEGNYSGQFADYLYERTGYQVNERLLKYDGRPFWVEEIVAKVKA
ncbi:MAG: hypothetical protein A2445_02810 [Candidatus Jacksonbacteria bacterium RIFOXYC2_FULL_44_29]|nr:MAG: Pyruvate flavodoxin/ferredoxin oxidoreductase domain protein [Parcubacteria group bacterium GW2011_GWC2_44_22]OGY75162.1 MAG: hypothetical protein A2240_00985 [Candidatus Jacksonbacteria bacterium RIFOXYA2_FULL_43_12]OGY77149.1 MAG: hypothetical protein A2445_02810 [Candidatus Jacksonbacteria bacterium RIFOXYC2_FULL_44_29]OGY77933.1 MAG: hypothetical protein A2295_00975 [Candidatus Jacksonbacteria bacterium RIFOXYB2_FULL_44_15]OGY79498.1 MAG: hypothetical protein A2550_01990 [Candidatus